MKYTDEQLNSILDGGGLLTEDEILNNDLDELYEGMSESKYAKAVQRTKKTYYTKLNGLQKAHDAKVKATAKAKEKALRGANAVKKGMIRETFEDREKAIADGFKKSKELLSEWRERELDALRLKKEKGFFNAERGAARKEAKALKTAAKYSMKRSKKI